MIVGAIIFQLLTHEHGREGQFLEQSGWMLWVQECQTEKKKKGSPFGNEDYCENSEITELQKGKLIPYSNDF